MPQLVPPGPSVTGAVCGVRSVPDGGAARGIDGAPARSDSRAARCHAKGSDRGRTEGRNPGSVPLSPSCLRTHPGGTQREPIRSAMRHHLGMRKLLSFLTVLFGVSSLAVVTSSATAVATAKPGVATGRAVPCAGLAAEPVARLSVYHGSVFVSRKTVPAGSTFRFDLPPGTYVISNQGHPGRYVGTKPFRVRSGQTTHVVVRNFCE